MKSKLFLLAFLLLSGMAGLAQYENLTFSPAQPKPGDNITFEYSTAGTVLGGVNDFDAVAYLQDGTVRAKELSMKQIDGKWTGTIITNDSTKAVLLVFKKDELTDNNKEQGYSLLLMENGKPVKGAYSSLVDLNNFGGFLAQMKVSPETNLKLYETENALYPELKTKNLPGYSSVLMRADKDKAVEKIKLLIKGQMDKPLTTEDDYSSVMSAYNTIKDKKNADELKAEILKKFPNGNLAKRERENKFYNEQDFAKKEILLKELLKSNPQKTEQEKASAGNLYNVMASAAVNKKDWALMKKYAAKISNKYSLASLYNEAAWKLVGEGMDGKAENLDMANDLSAKSLEYMKEARKNLKNKPPYLTDKAYEENIDYSTGNFYDTYALILWKKGEFEKAYAAQQQAMEKTKKSNPEIIERYIVFKEKVKGPASVKTELEDLIKEGKSTPKMKDILKTVYLSENHTEAEYAVYMEDLLKAFREKMRADLMKKMIDEAAPSFALMDLSGNSVSLADMKGKVVVVDFWAIWCGPCRASFPGMQTAVTKYKDDPDVKFVFVDTWENKKPDVMEKDAAEFIKKNKYDFHVLLDKEDKIVQGYAVDGIPTKFVIDPNSRIRFKAVGFEGNADKLVDEMSIMIEALKPGGDKKGF